MAAVREAIAKRGVEALIPIGGDDTLGVAVDAARSRRSGGGGAEDDRQRPRRHRLHVRLPDRRPDRHRRDRPPAHDGRVARPRDGRRGDGPPRRLDRDATPGIAGGADAILVPERPFDIEEVCAHLQRRHGRGRKFSIVVVAEGATPLEGTLEQGAGFVTRDATTDAFGHERLGGIGVVLEREIERRTGYEARVTILGHVQRGGTPVAFDRVLATRFGVAAVRAVAAGRFGTMVALRGTRVVELPMTEALAEPKLLDPELYETAELFFG